MSRLEWIALVLVLLIGIGALAGAGYVLLNRERGATGPNDAGTVGPASSAAPSSKPPDPFPATAPQPVGTPRLQGAPTGAVRGLVTDAATQAPVSDADVRAWAVKQEPAVVSQGRSGPDGRFAFEGVPARAGMWLVVSAPGFAPGLVEKLAVPAGQAVDAGTVALARTGGRVQGWVRDASGAGLAGAEVRLMVMVATGEQTRSAAPVAALVTGSDGRFEFSPVPPGRQGSVMASKAGYATVSQTVSVPFSGEAPAVALQLSKTGQGGPR